MTDEDLIREDLAVLVPIYIRGTKYYCPYCDHETWLFTWVPVLTDAWRCKKCRKRFLLDVKAVADNWVNTLALWSLPLGFVFSFVMNLVEVVRDGNILQLIFFTLMMTVVIVIVAYVLLMPVGLIAGAVIVQRNAGGRRGRKYVVREIS